LNFDERKQALPKVKASSYAMAIRILDEMLVNALKMVNETEIVKFNWLPADWEVVKRLKADRL